MLVGLCAERKKTVAEKHIMLLDALNACKLWRRHHSDTNWYGSSNLTLYLNNVQKQSRKQNIWKYMNLWQKKLNNEEIFESQAKQLLDTKLKRKRNSDSGCEYLFILESSSGKQEIFWIDLLEREKDSRSFQETDCTDEHGNVQSNVVCRQEMHCFKSSVNRYTKMRNHEHTIAIYLASWKLFRIKKKLKFATLETRANTNTLNLLETSSIQTCNVGNTLK